ncbi:hypothetical protein Tco_0521906 [Tanacetum coccineum]
MAKDDEEKTAFHTSQGVYCYTKMPFGLKNAGATYQRLVDNAFEGQVGRNLEVYVDDLEYKRAHDAERHVPRVLDRDGRHQAVSRQNKAVIQLPSPRTMKEVQSLNGKLAGLNQDPIPSQRQSHSLVQTLKSVRKEGGDILVDTLTGRKKRSASSSSI